jgi:8-amino-7-oxononanoate synthase
VVQTITLSKGFGVYGGAVLCSQSLARRIMVKGRLFAGATPLPLPLVNATLASLKLVSTDRSLVERLQRNAYFVKARLLEAGWPDAATPGPIVSFVPASARQAGALKKRLLDGGILPPLIRYGNGPAHGYFRFAISSAHTQEQLENLVSVLTEFLKGGSKR